MTKVESTNRKLYLNLFCIIILAISLFALIRIWKDNLNRNYGTGSIPFSTDNSKAHESRFLNYYLTSAIKDDSFQIDSKTKLNDVLMDKQILFEDLLKDKKRLLIIKCDIFSSKQGLALQKNLQRMKNIDKVIFICKYVNKHNLLAYQSPLKNPLIYTLQNNIKGIGLFMEKEPIPFLFSVDSNFIVSKIFPYLSGYEKEIGSYLSQIDGML